MISFFSMRSHTKSRHGVEMSCNRCQEEARILSVVAIGYLGMRPRNILFRNQDVLRDDNFTLSVLYDYLNAYLPKIFLLTGGLESHTRPCKGGL